MKYWIGIGISVALLALFLFTADVRRMFDTLGDANYWYLIPAVGMYLVSIYFRSMRWSVMLRHLKPISARRLYPVVVIGYMANNLLPMRLGEIVRSYYLGEREGISKTSTLVTVLIERVFDALTLLFFIAVVALFMPISGLATGLAERTRLALPVLALAFSLPFVMAFAILILFARFPEQTRAQFMRLARLFPSKVESLADSLSVMLLNGLTPLSRPSTLLILFLMSIPIWLAEAVAFYIIAIPFGIAGAYDGFTAAAAMMVVTTSVTNIASSIPAAPGGVGLFEIVARETLVLGPASIDRATAGGFALLVHATLILPMIVLGQVFLWASHLSLRRLSRRVRREETSVQYEEPLA